MSIFIFAKRECTEMDMTKQVMQKAGNSLLRQLYSAQYLFGILAVRVFLIPGRECSVFSIIFLDIFAVAALNI